MRLSDSTAAVPTSDAIIGELFDQLARRLEAGAPLDVDELAREYPEHAEQLARILPTLLALADLGHLDAIGPATAETASGPRPSEIRNQKFKAPSGVLGDFQIVRELGRGGMGIVYEAEQISLQRKVALKVLPFAGLFDKRALARFQNEARAAATLEHPHIVPVYGVGEDRNVYYYAMRLIRGQSLAELISGIRQGKRDGRQEPESGGQTPEIAGGKSEIVQQVPLTTIHSPRTSYLAPNPNPQFQIETQPFAALSTEYSQKPKRYFRRVAEIGIQIAEALDHAHQCGILHRDVKPANILLDSDGKAWITDFGLARIGSDPSVTASGDLVGTLRYMSPEQVSGQTAVVDHRSDVYSLGVTLYELATGTPAFEGHDRGDILRRISEEDPRPPRALRPAMPPDLETVIQKAIEKEPIDRYTSAQELAEDLRRFVDSKPVVAKRASVAKHIAKWSRRNRAVVAASIATLIASLTIGTVLLWRSNLRTRDALHESAANLQKARAVVDDMYVRVAEEWLKDKPYVTKVQRDFLEKAASFYEALPAAPITDADATRQAALVQYRVASIRCAMADVEQATNAYRRAVGLYSSLVKKGSTEKEDRQSLAKALIRLAGHTAACPSADDPDYLKHHPEVSKTARERLTQAKQLLLRLGEETPGDAEIQESLAEAYYGLSTIHFLGQEYDLAKPLAKRAVGFMEASIGCDPTNAERQAGLMKFLERYARVLWATGRRDEAEQAFRRAVASGEAALAIHPESHFCRQMLADCLNNLGNLLRERDSVAASIPLWEQASTLADELVERFPDLLGNLDSAAVVHQNLSSAYQEPDTLDLEKAIFHKRKRVEMHSRIVEIVPGRSSAEQIGQLSDDFVRLGELLNKAGRQDESVQAYKDAKRHTWKLVEAAQRDVDEAPNDDERRLRLYKKMIMYWSLIAATEGRESPAALDYEERTQLQLHRLSAGPEIEGPDVDGDVFKLSDYRGKVVMLDFFGDWCPSCRVLYPMERGLVETYENRPFALLGVNVDSPEALQRLVGQQEVTWRCWADGRPIANRWRVPGYPTIYLIDHRGAVRYHSVGVAEDDENLTTAVEELVREAELASGRDTPVSGAPDGG